MNGGRLVPWEHAIERLAGAAVYWLATSGAHGQPHVVPVWGVLVDFDLYLEVGASTTAKVRHLHRDARVAVHLDDPEDVVIVHGTARFVAPLRPLAVELVAAFRDKYPGYLPENDAWADGSLVLIDPRTVLAWWDMPTATRWRFPVSLYGA